MKIYAPNKQYTGVSAGVAFAAGVGYCDNPERLEWFRKHGYTVEAEAAPVDVSDLVRRAEKLKLDLPDGLTADQVLEAVEKAEQDAEKTPLETPKTDAKAGAKNAKNGG